MSCSTTTTECRPASERRKFGRAHRFLVRHARDRLVQQQQSRLLHQQHPDLEPLLLAVRRLGQSIGLRGELDQAQRLGDPIEVAAREPRTTVFRTRLSAFIASSRFSKTECRSNTVGFWNLRPIPA